MKHVEAITHWLKTNRGILYDKYGYARADYFHKIDLHHALRNNKGNRKNYPLLLNSIINLHLIKHNYHIDHHGACPVMSYLQADKYERFLERHPKIAAWVNNPVGYMFKEAGKVERQLKESVGSKMTPTEMSTKCRHTGKSS